MDYKQIKGLAKQHGLSIRDLIALTPQNDPFYVGTKGDIAKANWFGRIWEQFGYTRGVHLRRIHYRLDAESPPVIKPNREPYRNTERDWAFLGQASKCARYLDTVDPGAFVDRKHPAPKRYARSKGDLTPSYTVRNPFKWNMPLPNFMVRGYTNANLQPYLVEVWIEKTTMNDVLIPLCRRYGVNLVTFTGEMSITSTLALVDRAEEAGRPCRIFFVSDFDPTGMGMPIAVARKIEFFVREYGLDLDIRLEPIALTRDQVTSYKLPRKPIKESNLSKGRFEDVHGRGAVELDALEALHPGELGRIVERAILAYYDPDIEIEAEEQRKRLKDVLKEAKEEALEDLQPELERLQGEVQDLFSEMTERLEGIEVDLDEYPVPEPEEFDEKEGQLFDTGRDYLDQIGYYKARRAGMDV